MKQIRYIACVIIISMLFCSGCSGDVSTSGDSETGDSTDLSAIVSGDDDLLKESEGATLCGFQSVPEEGFTYSGSDLEVPLYVGTMDNSEDVEVAAILFLNGEVQPYSYELNGEVSETKMAHYFTLGPDETLNFTAFVSPVSGEAGDVLGMQFAVVFKPDYLPDQEGNTSFGNCGRINSTVCLPVNMKVSGTNETKAYTAETTVTDIPEEVMAMLDGMVIDDADNPLDYSPYLKIDAEDSTNCLCAENGKLNLTVQMYGGKEITSKVTFFVNNEPVKVEDCDYVEVETTSDKMTVFDVCIDVSEYDELCSFYAVAAASGDDYLIQDDAVQSERCLLINK